LPSTRQVRAVPDLPRGLLFVLLDPTHEIVSLVGDPSSSPSLDRVADDPAIARDLSAEHVVALLARCSVAQGALVARLLDHPRGEKGSGDNAGDNHDHLLTVEQTTERLGASVDWLYRHADGLPFIVRVGRRVRFSAQGLDRYIRDRAGRSD
jgi:predicted DNA-binding transcriptional regulator AlpA